MPKLSEETIRALPLPEAGSKVHYFAKAKLQGVVAPAGFGVRVTANGAKAFILNYRLRGREHRLTIGSTDAWSAIKAVRHARELRQQIDRGENPLDDRKPKSEGKTVAEVLDDFMARYARAKGKDGQEKLRGADGIESAFERLVKPRVGKIGIYDLTRRHVAEMLDKIEDASGPVAADRTRAYFRKALGWYAERDEKFNLNAAIVRVDPRATDRARSRTLSDDEIRALWPALDGQGTFGAMLKVLLLTGQRRKEVAGMTCSEIDKDGIWEIPATRYKTKRPHAVPLSQAALALIQGQPVVNGFIFASSTGTALSAFGQGKAAIDMAIALPHWTLHDLRRTARTLLARAGVRPDISERVLGHVIAGVAGVYDRHDYEAEKRDALERLAALVERIVNPPAANVLPMKREA
jgi:integrase